MHDHFSFPECCFCPSVECLCHLQSYRPMHHQQCIISTWLPCVTFNYQESFLTIKNWKRLYRTLQWKYMVPPPHQNIKSKTFVQKAVFPWVIPLLPTVEQGYAVLWSISKAEYSLGIWCHLSLYAPTTKVKATARPNATNVKTTTRPHEYHGQGC